MTMPIPMFTRFDTGHFCSRSFGASVRKSEYGYLHTDHPRCAIAENPCISSIGNGNTIMDVRSPAMSNSVLR